MSPSIGNPVFDLEHKQLISLITRLDLTPALARLQVEDEIARVVPIDYKWLSEAKATFLQSETLELALSRLYFTEDQLDLHLWREKALRIFAQQLFAPLLEEVFLASHGAYDQLIYSLIRVRDPGLARELWIRLEEGEASFAQLAADFGEGPESGRLGIFGPLLFSSITPPQLATMLKTLKPGEIHKPTQLGDWYILLRLERFIPAQFDDSMISMLLDQKLNEYINHRVKLSLTGAQLPPIDFNP